MHVGFLPCLPASSLSCSQCNSQTPKNITAVSIQYHPHVLHVGTTQPLKTLDARAPTQTGVHHSLLVEDYESVTEALIRHFLATCQFRGLQSWVVHCTASHLQPPPVNVFPTRNVINDVL
jgi:hypothetical protein